MAGQIAAFASRELGLTLTPAQAEMVETFEAGGFSDAVWQCGRRGGKSLVADVLAVYDATMRDHLREGRLRASEPRTAAIIAQNLDKAQRHVSNCLGLIRHSKRLSRMVVEETTDRITFGNGSVIQAYPCSARSIRGDAWSSVILDELGHYVTSDEGPAAGDRVYEAARPALAQFAGAGWCVAISTPLWKKGRFWTLVQQATSGRYPEFHYRHLDTATMNPTISADWLENERKRDPDLYLREYAAQFIDGASAYLCGEDVLGCKRETGILPPVQGRNVYEASIDPAFARDNFALCVAHREDGCTVVDGVWTWKRAGFEAVLDELTAILGRYRVRKARTDQFSEAAIREGLQKRGIEAIYEPWTQESKAEAFGRLKAAINTRSIEIPNDAELIEELCGLEARPTPGGKYRIAAAGSGHDDRATVVASVVAAIDAPAPGLLIFSPNFRERADLNDPNRSVDVWDDPEDVQRKIAKRLTEGYVLIGGEWHVARCHGQEIDRTRLWCTAGDHSWRTNEVEVL